MTLAAKRDKRNCYLVIIKYLEANGQAEQLFNLYIHFSRLFPSSCTNQFLFTSFRLSLVMGQRC
jgi:hypothetical protein